MDMESIRALHKDLHLQPGTKITIETDKLEAELTAHGCEIKRKASKGSAVQAVIAAGNICRDMRAEIIRPSANPELVARNLADLQYCADSIKEWLEDQQKTFSRV